MTMKAQKPIANAPKYFSRSEPFAQLYVPQPLIEPVLIKIWWYQKFWDWLIKITTPKQKPLAPPAAPAISLDVKATPEGESPEIKLDLDQPEKKKK